MPGENLKELSPENLVGRRRSHIKRYLITIALMVIFTLYPGYLDLIKKSEYSHMETYIFIAIGVFAITIELIYKSGKIALELKNREKE